MVSFIFPFSSFVPNYRLVLSRLPELVTLLRNLSWHEDEIRTLRMQLSDEKLRQEFAQVNLFDETDEKSGENTTEALDI